MSSEDRSRDPDVRALEERIEQLEHERDGYYGEWRHAQNQLEDIRSSKAWRLWMVSIRARRVPRALLRRLGDALGWLLSWLLSTLVAIVRGIQRGIGRTLSLVPRFLGWSWLCVTTATAFARARLRRADTPPPPAAPGEDARRPRVLLVSPYCIFPANHGGGVRLSNLVRLLAERCDVYALVFSQIGEDPEQRKALERYCKRVDFHRWVPRHRPDLLGLTPPSAQLFDSDRAATKLRDIVLAHDIDVVQLEYTELGQYHRAVPAGTSVILTEHDIAFRSFGRRRALGFSRRFPEGSAFGVSRSDWMRLFRHELAVCRAADQIHTMSSDDGRYLSKFLPDGADRIRVVPNAVDCVFYTPPDDAPPRRDVLYVGNYQNLPNVDALEYFAIDVWPLLRLEHAEARLDVVGANPSDRVMRFDEVDGITVVGPVPDLRDAYHRHRVMVAPIRAGSGTRLKILEALAAGIPVVTTTLGAEGIEAEDGKHLLVADTAVDFARAVARVLTDDVLAESLATAGRDLVRRRYDWQQVADDLVSCYHELIGADAGADLSECVPAPQASAAAPATKRPSGAVDPDVSIVIPTLNGGELLTRSLEAIAGQTTELSWELLCIDSQSATEEVESMRRHGAEVVQIDCRTFNHGLTRDQGARLGRGEIIVFLNQDAIPTDDHWLERLTEPLRADNERVAAVQGGIAELPDPALRFYWDSCGARFYFTRESERWIADHAGIGFSTVNCAIRRSVWQRYPFGWAPIMEDKKWQREVVEAGWTIVDRPDAAVYHTHDYDLQSLLRRCASEGYGWRTLGERYSLGDMTRDMMQRQIYGELLRGIRDRRIQSTAEVLFPWVRPITVYWGNHLSREVRL